MFRRINDSVQRAAAAFDLNPQPRTARLLDVAVGATVEIASITSRFPARLERLATYGIVPGSEVTLVARMPSCVISCGASSVALDDDIAREIAVILPI